MKNRILNTRIILRIHGSILILATTALNIVGWLGYTSALGPYGQALHDEKIGYIGLFQAYALMMVLGIVVWIGSFDEKPRKWHLIGMAAHLFPLLANFIFWDDIEHYGITHSGIILHVVMMILELVGYLQFKTLQHAKN